MSNSTNFPSSSVCLSCRLLSSSHSDDLCLCVDSPSAATDVMSQVPEMRVTLITYAVCMAFGAAGNIIVLVALAMGKDRKSR